MRRNSYLTVTILINIFGFMLEVMVNKEHNQVIVLVIMTVNIWTILYHLLVMITTVNQDVMLIMIMSYNSNNPVWNGEGCPQHEATCCISPTMPWSWHVKTLNETVNDDIELSVCGSVCNYCENLIFGAYSTPIDLVELYINWRRDIKYICGQLFHFYEGLQVCR